MRWVWKYLFYLILHEYLSIHICSWPVEIKFFCENLTSISFFNFIEPLLEYLSIYDFWTSLNHFTEFMIILTSFISWILINQIFETLNILILIIFSFLIINILYEWFKSNKWFNPRFKNIINISKVLFKAVYVEWILNLYFMINFQNRKLRIFTIVYHVNYLVQWTRLKLSSKNGIFTQIIFFMENYIFLCHLR